MSTKNMPTRPRVVLVGMHYSPEHSGNAPYTTGLARHLATNGFKTTVVTGYPHYPEWRLHAAYRRRRSHEWDGDVLLRRLRHPVPRRPTSAARALMELVFAIKSGVELLRRRTDIVIAISPVLLSLVPAVLFRKLRRYRLGIVIQDLYGAALAETGMAGGFATRVIASLELALLRRADSIVVIHDVFRTRLVSAGVSSARIRVIPNWAHVEPASSARSDQARRDLGWREDEFVALHAGNMGMKQGLEGLVDVARLAEQRGSSVSVVLMGDGSRRSGLEDYGAGISRLRILDPLPSGEFEAALAAADCLLLHEKPGVVEMSVPSKLTSYFTAGRPVVAATHRASGAAAIMNASDAGYIAPPGDAAAILRAIERIAADPDRATAMGHAGRRYAENHLGSTQALNHYEAWVRMLLGL